MGLLIEDSDALRFVQLSAGARAYDMHTQGSSAAKRAYRAAREAAGTVQQSMRQGDAVDSELMATIEENSDTLDQGCRAMARRAFIGLDHPVWSNH